VSFSDELRRAADPVWRAQHEHPFIRGIADGSLDLERFRFYVRQDYLFLIEYARLLSLGAARAPDLDTMSRFADLAQAVLRTEMDLHRSFAGELDISPSELEFEEMAPTTRAYTDFLVRTAAQGDFVELVAALLPCMWGYAEIGERLLAEGRPAEERYARWVEMYASEDFAGLARWCRELMDRAAASIGEERRGQLTTVFLTSSRYELAFWQMAWERERWPV
jgi:thiaminase (transcriptional activator TenA)